MSAVAGLASIPATAPATGSGWVRDSGRYGFWMQLMLVLAFAMSFMPGGFDYASLDRGIPVGDGSLVAQLQWLPLFGLAFAMLLMRWRLLWALLGRLNPFMLLTLLWIFLSVLWSDVPVLSLKRAIKYLGVGFIALAFMVHDWSPLAVIRVLRRAATIMVFASIAFMLLMPEYGIHQGYSAIHLKGNWRGLTMHKNTFGILCVYSMMLWVHAWGTRDVPLRRCLVPLIATLVCLIGCRSTTSLVTAVIAAGMMVYLLRMPKAFNGLSFFLLTASVLLGVFSVLLIWTGVPTPMEFLEIVTGGVGKEATFTGRDVIWSNVAEQISQHPWMGVGYYAFWIPGELSGPAGDVVRQIGFLVNNSHNGYLETLNELGIIGLGLLVAFIVCQFWQLSTLMRWNRGVAAFGLVFMVYELFLNVSEAYFWRTTTAPAVMEWVVVAMTARTLMHYRWQARRPA